MQITINDININILDGPIGLSMSGGADSTLLFYILMKYSQGPIFVFSVGNGLTNYQEPLTTLNTITQIVKETKRRDIYFRSHFVEQKKIDTAYPWQFMLGSEKLNALYFAFTRPPPLDAITDYDTSNSAAAGGVDHGLELPTEWPNKLQAVPILGEGIAKACYDGKSITPFININKQRISELYKILDIERFYSMSRSCESLTHIGEQCGKCWYCKERIWAFGKLN